VSTKLKVGDPVFHGDPPVSYFIVAIDAGQKTVDLKAANGKSLVIHHNVAWSELTLSDESQNAARIAREATEQD
jgi:putative NIF3 family GTP cyclohydrolase 1 type 2